MNKIRSKRVVVVRGGPSEEYDVSMKTGAGVIEALQKLNYNYKDVIITRGGEWLDNGFARSPEQILQGYDVLFLALHGNFGEDGAVQRIAERIGMPFTGSRAFPSSVALNKDLTKKHACEHGILTPEHLKVTRTGSANIARTAAAIKEMFGPEYVIKPINSGSSLGTVLVYQHEDLTSKLQEALQSYEEVMVEEMIRGKEGTVGVLEGFRDQKLYQLPSVEIIPPEENEFFDYECKYNGKTAEICPGRFSDQENKMMTDVALKIHKTLGLTQYSRSDFMLRDGEVYFLEVNTLPGLTSESLLPKSLQAVGASYEDLVEHLVETAIVS